MFGAILESDHRQRRLDVFPPVRFGKMREQERQFHARPRSKPEAGCKTGRPIPHDARHAASCRSDIWSMCSPPIATDPLDARSKPPIRFSRVDCQNRRAHQRQKLAGGTCKFKFDRT